MGDLDVVVTLADRALTHHRELARRVGESPHGRPVAFDKGTRTVQ